MGESVWQAWAEGRSAADRPPYRDHTAWDHRRGDIYDAYAAIPQRPLRLAGTLTPGSVGGAKTVPAIAVTSDVRTMHGWWWHVGPNETVEMTAPVCHHPDPEGGRA